MPQLLDIAKRTKAWACYDCGKCTATCPLTRAGADYSPRRHVLATNLGHETDIVHNGKIFDCLTCRMCDARCPVGVEYIELVKELRALAGREHAEVECPHGGALQSTMRIMAQGKMKQERLKWLPDDLQIEPQKGTVFYWVGCTPYYDAFFPEFELTSVRGSAAAVRLLNRLGLRPVVSADERCCGHDLLWNGDRESFELLTKHNIELVTKSGAETLVVGCAECLRTWRQDYVPLTKAKLPKIVHLTEFLADHLEELKPTDKAEAEQALEITYQDPCRLGRHLGVYDPPREVLRAAPGVNLAEMPRAAKAGVCCAGGTWSNCDRYAKKIQVERLREARATGATVLATACPKCQVHLRCAMQDPNLKEQIEIELRDVAEVLDDALGQNRAAAAK